MFSLLNKRIGTGKHRVRMYKILNSLPQFFHTLSERFSKNPYLIEGRSFIREDFVLVGHRIAFLVRQPVLLRIRSRKD